jgi:hypothetical protein
VNLPLHVSSSLLRAFRTVNDCDHDICPTCDVENENRAAKVRPRSLFVFGSTVLTLCEVAAATAAAAAAAFSARSRLSTQR